MPVIRGNEGLDRNDNLGCRNAKLRRPGFRNSKLLRPRNSQDLNVVVGFDATEDARDAIRKSKMDGSIAQHPYEMGRLAIENARKIIDGQMIPSFIPVNIDLITKEKLEDLTD